MKQNLKNAMQLMALTATCLLALSFNAEAGEKKKLNYHKSLNRQTISEVKSYPGNGRELIQGVYSDTVISADVDWNGIEERVYEQVDQVDGNGTDRGTAVNIFPNGDKIFQNYQGTHKTTGQGDNVETVYEGKSEIVGGTGKYKNAKGIVTYTAKITPKGIEENDIVDMEY